MNKKNLHQLIIALIIILIVLGLLIFCKIKLLNQNNNQTLSLESADILSQEELNNLGLYHLGIYKIVARDENGQAFSYKFIGLKNAQAIEPEFMSDLEKAEKHISPDIKAQVLERNSTGQVIVYRLINNDSDIVSKY